MDWNEVRLKAEQVRFEFERQRDSEDDDFALDIVALAASHGFTVYSGGLKEDSGIVLIDKNGLPQFDNARQVIVVNESDSALRKRFTIAHELGHYFLHLTEAQKSYVAFRDANHGIKGEKEKEAEFFASNLLMPANKVAAALRAFNVSAGSERVENKIRFISNLFLVSADAARVRLSYLGLL